jgi:hypothetical protein
LLAACTTSYVEMQFWDENLLKFGKILHGNQEWCVFLFCLIAFNVFLNIVGIQTYQHFFTSQSPNLFIYLFFLGKQKRTLLSTKENKAQNFQGIITHNYELN